MTKMIDILVPTYEPNPEYLLEALKCIQAQTYPNWTVFIHDDASKVGARAMVEPFLADPRFKFERSGERLGIAGNWNACVAKTSNPLVQFLFQDDLWEPNYLERAVTAFDDASIGLVSVAHNYLNKEGLKLEEYEHVQAAHRRELPVGKINGMEFLRKWIQMGLHPNLIGEPSFVMLRRAVMQTVGPFNGALPQSLDSEYWMRIVQHGDIFNVTESLGAFRVHSMGTSAKNQREAKGMFDRLLMFRRLNKELRGTDKKLSKDSTVRELGRMIEKFKNRIASETSETAGPSRKKALLKFILKHPLFMAWCGANYIIKNR